MWRRRMSHRREHDPEVIRRLDEIERQNHEILREIRALRPVKYTISITQENSMSTTPIIVAGSTGSFTAVLFANGSTYVPPAGSTYVPSYTWSASDATVSLVPSADTTQVVATVPASDTATAFTLGASTLAPDGTTANGTLVVPIGPSTGATTFTVSISQNPAAAPS